MLPHLSLTPFHLRSGGESGPAELEWFFIRIDSGFAYWMGPVCPVELPVGVIIVIPPGGTGLLRASQMGDCAGRKFGLRPDALAGVLTFQELRAVERLAGSLDNGIKILAGGQSVSAHFDALGVEGCAGITRRIRMLSIVAEVFDGMMAGMPDGKDEPSVPTASDRFRRLMEESTESELLNLSPDELAARCRCGVRHLNRLFREQFGVSMRGKLTELRLRMARDLLSEADAEVENVARATGFAHPGFFRAAFKRHMGVTPAEWRRSVQK